MIKTIKKDMMAPKEKAIELIDKMYATQNPNGGITMDEARQCALICVDEFFNFQTHLFITDGSLAYQYWQEVKKELEL